MVPGLGLDRLIAKRRLAIENGLPDALDLLIVSLEAGLGLDQAILKSAEELAIAHPELAEELRLINVECRAGKPRIEAFKNFSTRTKVDDVRSLVAMLVQTDRFGTSVAQALRTHAEVSRTKRRQRAEERAAKIGVKLVFPLVFCLFPAFFVVTIGPAIIKFTHAFGSGGFAALPPASAAAASSRVSSIPLRWATIQTSEQRIEQKNAGGTRAPGALKAKPALARLQTAQG